MRQGIEKKRKKKPSEVAVTVMFHGRRLFSCDNESFCEGADTSSSLSEWSAVIANAVSNASSQSLLVTLLPHIHTSRDGSRGRPLPPSEKFSAEEPMACSALAVLTANPNTRSPQAAATVITTMTEQRRCAAA